MPLTVKSEAGVPSGVAALNDQVWIAQVSTEPIRTWISAAESWLTELPPGIVPATRELLLAGSHALIVKGEALQEEHAGQDIPTPFSPVPGGGLVPSLAGHQVLDPVIVRAFASLLTAARLYLHYSSYFGVNYDGTTAHVTQSGGMLCQTPWPIDGTATCDALSKQTLDTARDIYSGLAVCEGRHQRPVFALDAFYSGLLERDWRIRVILMVVALEALLGTRDQELKHQVCERAASFAEPPGKARFEAYAKLKDLYSLRSDLVHGGFSSPFRGKRKHTLSLLGFLEDVARKTLRQVLGDQRLVKRFCSKPDDLNEFLEKCVFGIEE
jgi:hypothetical protein